VSMSLLDPLGGVGGLLLKGEGRVAIMDIFPVHMYVHVGGDGQDVQVVLGCCP
jgi:hypothetical protein